MQKHLPEREYENIRMREMFHAVIQDRNYAYRWAKTGPIQDDPYEIQQLLIQWRDAGEPDPMQWLQQSTPIDEVLEDLAAEFYPVEVSSLRREAHRAFSQCSQEEVDSYWAEIDARTNSELTNG